MPRGPLAIAGLFIMGVLFPGISKAQTGLVDPRTTAYVCFLSRTQEFAENGKPIILVLPCEAASVRHDALTDDDYEVLEQIQLVRILFKSLKDLPAHASEIEPTRAEFAKLVKEICDRHPKIALLPLDWKVEQTRLSQITESGAMALKTCAALP
jgi:hypothetical protein